MRALAKTNSAVGAAAFRDALTAKGVECRIDEGDDGTWTLWIIDDSQFDAAADLLKQYQASAGAARKPLPQRLAAAPLTASLVAISVIVTLVTNFGQNENLTDWFYFDPESILSGQIWRLLTPIFLHLSILHLVFNMFWLLDLGEMLERRFGRLYLGVLIAVIGILSCLTQYCWDGPYFGGMSGVIYGLFGFIWIRSKYDPAPGFGIQKNNVILLIVWLFLCMTGWLGHVADAAHVSGLLTGMAWAYIPRLRSKN